MKQPKLGKQLRNLRNAHSMSLPTLAKKAGISKGHLSKIENGRSTPTVTVMNKILKPFELKLFAKITYGFPMRCELMD